MMMKIFWICLSVSLFALFSEAKTIKVAVIDTGAAEFILNNPEQYHLCKTDHKDFTGTSIVDKIGHGTNIIGLINRYAKDSNYCIIVLKFMDLRPSPVVDPLVYALKLNVDFINLSIDSQPYIFDLEKDIIKRVLDSDIRLVMSAGNSGIDLCKTKLYPVSADERIIVVGNGVSEKERLTSSNYGCTVDAWEKGFNEEVFGRSFSGSSQSAAVHTGKLIRSYDAYLRTITNIKLGIDNTINDNKEKTKVQIQIRNN